VRAGATWRIGLSVGLATMLVSVADPSAAATVSWAGEANDTWSAPASWSSGTPPSDGDFVTFPAAPADYTSTLEDIGSLDLAGFDSAGSWEVERRNGAVVTLSGPFSVDLAGQPPVGSGHELIWWVPLELAAATTFTAGYDSDIVSLRGAITGGQTMRAVGPGQVLLQGGTNDIATLVADGASAGRVDVNGPDAAPDAVTVEEGGAVGFGDGTFAMPIRIGGSGTSAPSVPSSWAPGALRVRTNGQSVSPVLTGPVTLTAPTTLGTSTSATDSSLTLTGAITGGFPLTLVGAGTVTLGGDASGSPVISEVRELVVSGATGPVTAAAGSRVSGTGSIGGFVLPSGAALAVDVSGNGADHLTVTGAVQLDGALDLRMTSPPSGDVLLLDNAGTAPVSGSFAGLPEGAALTAGGRSWTITYQGGDGNDVVLRQVLPSAELTLTTQVDANGTGDPAGPGDWVLGATGPTTVSGPGGSAAVVDQAVGVGAYTLAATGPVSGWLTGAWRCEDTGGATVPVVAGQVTLADGDDVTCTVTSTAIPGTWSLGLTSTPPSGSVVAPGDVIDYTVRVARLAGVRPRSIAISGDVGGTTVVPGSLVVSTGTGTSSPTGVGWDLPVLDATATASFQFRVGDTTPDGTLLAVGIVPVGTGASCPAACASSFTVAAPAVASPSASPSVSPTPSTGPSSPASPVASPSTPGGEPGPALTGGSPGLPGTGGPTLGLVALGASLLLVGATVVHLGRRRRPRSGPARLG